MDGDRPPRLRRSGRTSNCPERFAEVDYHGLARAARESAKANVRHQDDGAADRQMGDSDQNMPAGNIEIDEEDVDSEEGVAEMLEPSSGDDGAEGDDVFYEAREAHVGWACLCSADEANDGLFAMLTGEASEAPSRIEKLAPALIGRIGAKLGMRSSKHWSMRTSLMLSTGRWTLPF